MWEVECDEDCRIILRYDHQKQSPRHPHANVKGSDYSKVSQAQRCMQIVFDVLFISEDQMVALILKCPLFHATLFTFNAVYVLTDKRVNMAA